MKLENAIFEIYVDDKTFKLTSTNIQMLMSVRDTHDHRLFCVSSNLLQVQLALFILCNML